MKELTKEEIFHNKLIHYNSNQFPNGMKKMFLKAMQEYSDQNTKPLVDEINDLKSQLLISEQKVKLNYVNLVDAINENEQLKEGISDLKFQLKAASRFRTL
jgi:hypothetical protein